jgi:hypothetical protein
VGKKPAGSGVPRAPGDSGLACAAGPGRPPPLLEAEGLRVRGSADDAMKSKDRAAVDG